MKIIGKSFHKTRHAAPKKVPSAESIKKSFGKTSEIFSHLTNMLKREFAKVKNVPEVQTAFEQWHRFLSIAYGSFNASQEIFLVHTYLSIFSKILAYTVLEPVEFIDDDKLKRIIAGDIFERLTISNFIEKDFYGWAALEDNFREIAPAFRIISQQLDEYDFTQVKEDILKGIYQELIDLETRHALGEYYTPDWLCEKILQHIDIRRDSTFLDPACGSGSFLRAVIDRLKEKYPDMSAAEIAQNVAGIDIHPLSVQVSKNTILLALAEKIRQSPHPVKLRVFLGNALSEQLSVFNSQFSILMGNPPWLTYKDITNKDYQDELRDLARKYRLLPKTANMPHLELAAIFLSHSGSYFLKPGGQMAFVLPRSFLTADHHNNTRSGKAKGFKIKSLWDLKDVTPLFRVPACVFFCEKSEASQSYGDIEPVKGFSLSGRLGPHDASLSAVKGLLKSEETEWRYVKLASHSAFSNLPDIKISGNVNYYHPYFKQGATIVPRNFYFVELSQDLPPDWNDRILSVKTSEAVRAVSKKPWKDFALNGRIHSKFLFRTALAKNIVPFGLIEPRLVVLPVSMSQNQKISVLHWEALKAEGAIETARWFKQAEEVWIANKTQKNKDISSEIYLNWQNKLTEQNLAERYLLIYTASAKDANAAVIDRKDSDLHFIAESKTYWFGTDNKDIAFYLCSFLNSAYANQIIKSFQTSGLFGPRDIHKRILEVPLEIYDAGNADHRQLAQLGKTCQKKAGEFLSDIKDYNVGTLRLQIRSFLSQELKAIDNILSL